MTRSSSFLAGIVLAGAVAAIALGDNPQWPLCVGGHPGKRPPDCTASKVPGCVSYGGLRKKPGFERDHYIPEGLCRGQLWCDQQPNVRYQPYPEATRKDAEERGLEDAVCAGRISSDAAMQQIQKDWPR